MAFNYYVSYLSVGTTGPFPFSSIDFIEGLTYESQLEVLIGNSPPNGDLQQSGIDYTVQETQQTVTLTEVLPFGDSVTLRRKTDSENRIIEFSQGAQVTARSLNKALDQLFFIVQENFTFQQTLIEFPSDLIDTSGITDGDALVWSSSAHLLIAGQPKMTLDQLDDYAGDANTDDVLTWSVSDRWVPVPNISFDETSDITFSGDVSFTGTIQVPSSTASSHAVNKGEVQSIVSDHSSTYNSGMLQRIEELEAASRNILARGRWWNKTSDYWCSINTSTVTAPTFTAAKSRNDWDNLKNLVLDGSGYISYMGVAHSPPVSDAAFGLQPDNDGSAHFSQVQLDTFYWDFSFEDSTIVPDDVNTLKPSQYHVQIDTEGLDDRVWGTDTLESKGYKMGGSLWYVHYWRSSDAVGNTSQGGGLQNTGWEYSYAGNYAGDHSFSQSSTAYRAGWVDQYPFFTDLNCFVPPTYRNHRHDITGSEPTPIIFEGSSWGMGHDAMQRHGGWNSLDGAGDPNTTGGWSRSGDSAKIMDDQYMSRKNITQPVGGIKVCNKTQYGFSVVYYIRRPSTWEYVNYDAGDSCWQTVTPYFLVDTTGANPNTRTYQSFPLPYNFNFNITVVA